MEVVFSFLGIWRQASNVAALIRTQQNIPSQPYWNPDPTKNVALGELPVLWLLSQLDIIDKHRIILVIAANLAIERFVVTLTSGEIQKVEPAPLLWKPWQEAKRF
jgi:hypothetical protein